MPRRLSQVSTGYGLPFRTPRVARLCEPTLEPAQLLQLSDAIKEGYFFEFFIDDLPVKGCVHTLH